ncbi:MAG: hypothetical protein ACK5CW_18495 [Verrucomicrobiota bacterium]|jgi:hypothetical protein
MEERLPHASWEKSLPRYEAGFFSLLLRLGTMVKKDGRMLSAWPAETAAGSAYERDAVPVDGRL